MICDVSDTFSIDPVSLLTSMMDTSETFGPFFSRSSSFCRSMSPSDVTGRISGSLIACRTEGCSMALTSTASSG